jgi:ubiquinone/menaquinone biosynthesis C-methylase UbiE
MNTGTMLEEKAAAAAFSKQAPVFDELYGKDTIIQYKRKRVRAHLIQYLQPDSSILELNAGTGEDAIYFASLGHNVHATDISPGMMERLKEKVYGRQLQDRVSHELCSFNSLELLFNKGPYDHIFSNFAGLNCTPQLDKVLASFDKLLKPSGKLTLVLLPRFCLWEFLLLFRGRFRTAFRRFSGKKGTRAHIEGEYFRCWYYDPAYVIKNLKEKFQLRSVEGLCTIVPPSYIEGFAEKHPKLYASLVKKENKRKKSWPWRNIGDYYIITLQKKS